MKHKTVYAVLHEFKRSRVAFTIAELAKPRNLSDTCFLGGRRHHREVVEVDIRIYFSGVFFTMKYRVI
jgi:hypothetical protein